MSEPKMHSTLSQRLSTEQASMVLVQCADVTILLDDDKCIDRTFASFDFDARKLDQWTGKSFASCVAPDSRSKLNHLFAENGLSSDGEGRWRHLNLCIDGKPDLPLLLKYFVFEDDHVVTRLLCGRDLRPLLGIQKRFQREVDLMSHEKSRLEKKLRFLQ